MSLKTECHHSCNLAAYTFATCKMKAIYLLRLILTVKICPLVIAVIIFQCVEQPIVKRRKKCIIGVVFEQYQNVVYAAKKLHSNTNSTVYNK